MDNESNRENEVALLGACLRDPSRFDALADIVTVEDFSWHAYGDVWRAMQELRDDHLSIDTVTVGDQLDRKNKLAAFMYDGHDSLTWSGRAALSKIRENGDPRSAESYAANVKDYAAKRRGLEVLNQGATWLMNGRKAHDSINDIVTRLSDIKTFDSKASKHTMTIAEAASMAYDHTGDAASGKIDMVTTGYKDFDTLLGGGMTAPDLLIIAARPGQGKTALLASIAKNAAEAKRHVVIFTLEMQNKQIAMRLIAMESGVSYDKQKSGRLTESDWPRYTNGVEVVASLPITLNDMPAISVSRMRQELRRLKQVDLVMVDYIQLGGVDGKYDRRDQEIGEISGGLKSIAKEFDVPVMAAAQLSRAVEQRSDKRPVLSDLRESGSIENDADLVAFIYRPDQYEKDSDKKNQAEVIIAKHRNGPTGSIDLIYKPELTRFESAMAHVERFER